MDSIVSAALEEICARCASGIPLPDLWPALHGALESSGLPPSDSVKRILWGRLLALPGLRFLVPSNGAAAPLQPQDPSVRSLEAAEGLGLTIVAEKHLRDNFVGLYDRNACGIGIPSTQRHALDLLASARTNGITQSELAKEFKIGGNKIFYIVRNLEHQQLIVRQSTIVREKESGMDRENELKNTSIVNTNLIHLYRYAKNMNLNSQQRIEITRPDLLENLGNADGSSLIGDDASRECVKDDVCVKDFLPAMRSVCDKLEEANGKVPIVADIKLALGYRKTHGHRRWRNILNRLKDASLVEEFQAKVKDRVVNCLRLLKKFDPKDFQPKKTTCGYDGFDSGQIVKHGKRGQITDQLFEVTTDQHIYDLIDAEGSRGITIPEVCKRLGLSPKKIHAGFLGMCSRFGMHVEPEIQDRTFVYRVWTSRNYQHYSTNIFPESSEPIPVINELSTESTGLISYDQSCQHIQMLHPTDDFPHSEEAHDGQTILETPSTCSRHTGDGDAQLIVSGITPQNLMGEFTNVGDAELGSATRVTESSVLSLKGDVSISSITSKNESVQTNRRLTSTVVGERREQRILKRLKNEKFILAAELHRWLEGLEKDKPTMMARKTLTRTLNKLQQEGLCKCIEVKIPVVTNYSRTRATNVILHPSVGDLSFELVDEIYKRQRHFDIQSRGGSARSKNDQDQPVTVLTGVQQSSSVVVDKPVFLEAMRANGFVLAKMVRAKLLHNFLWGYLSTLPDWHNALNSKEHGYDLEHSHSTRHLFELGLAIKAMPLELFLQVVGSSKVIDCMVDHCKLGLRLLDLASHEYKCLMDTYATGRLSSIIDILLRLKLIQLTREGLPKDANMLPHAVLTHAMELKPYIEEPLPRAISSSNFYSPYRHPKIRHDFVLSKQNAVDAYWETLEYCYAAADPTVVSHDFPGSAVPEVFHSRSWTSVRVMTVEQRMELLKRVGDDRPKKKLLFEECVNIAKELNLTVEQVLNVYYGTRRSRSRIYYRSSERKERENHTVAKKRKRGSLKHTHVDNGTRESSGLIMSTSNGDEQHTGQTLTVPASTKNHDNHLQACNADNRVNAEVGSGPSGKNDENCSLISQYAFPRPKLTRGKKFRWTDSSDRQLVIRYSKYRATMGARFHRVDWISLSDLPACPNICARRMALLNSNEKIRKAVMRLCNLLGERYAKYLAETCNTQENFFTCCDDSGQAIQNARLEGTFARNLSATQETTSTAFSKLFCWDDFEDPDIKMAVDEVLRYKRMAKLEYFKRVGSRDEKEWPNITSTDGANSDAGECVTPKEQDEVQTGPEDATLRRVERQCNGTNTTSTTVQSKSSSHQQPHRKFLKLLNKRGSSIRRPVSDSLAVANAIELLKLIFLSTSSAPEVQDKLASLLRLYSEYDLFEAVNYLREKNFMVVGQGIRPYVLSQKFWNNASCSPFPVDSGKRAADFSSWLHKQQKELMADGVSLTSELQCGEIFHLFGLVCVDELFISPCLPNSLKRKRENGKLSKAEKDKKQKPQGRIDTDFCSRREKGFPDIKVLLHGATIPRDNAVQLTTHKKYVNFSLSYEKKTQVNSYSSEEATGFLSLSNNLNKCHNFYDNNPPPDSQDESPCDAMTTYAALLSSRSVGTNEVINFSPEVFKSVYSAIHQAGEQGLSMEEISEIMDMQGVEKAKLVVDRLKVFQFATKVNAYDSVRVVDSSYRSKYFINSDADCHQDQELTTYMKSRVTSYEVSQQLLIEKHDNIDSSGNVASVNLSDGHKLTILDLPKKPARIQLEAVPVRGDEVEDDTYPASGVHMSRPILPWINGDGSMNTIVYKGLTRRVFGTVMQNPGILEEDIIRRMDVLNPQSCRELLESMILDKHITVRMMSQTTTAPPSILQSLIRSDFKKPDPGFRKHYFANAKSTSIL